MWLIDFIYTTDIMKEIFKNASIFLKIFKKP